MCMLILSFFILGGLTAVYLVKVVGMIYDKLEEYEPFIEIAVFCLYLSGWIWYLWDVHQVLKSI